MLEIGKPAFENGIKLLDNCRQAADVQPEESPQAFPEEPIQKLSRIILPILQSLEKRRGKIVSIGCRFRFVGLGIHS